MNNFDDKIKKLAKQEDEEVPSIVLDSIDDTLNALPEKGKTIKLSTIMKRTLSAVACIAITFLFILPNVSITYAKSIDKVPVLGKLASLITFRNYTYHDTLHDMEINTPSLNSNDGSVESLNNDINALTNKLVGKFYSELELESNGYGSIYMDYETQRDTDRWFTLKLSISEVSASSNNYYKYYHIDKATGQIITLNDLFKNANYKSIITENIKSQMLSQMKNDENIVYWMNEEEFSEAFTSINNDHNFYWNNDGNLVIVFDKYEVGPGSIGTPEFVIDKALIENCLKPQYKNI